MNHHLGIFVRSCSTLAIATFLPCAARADITPEWITNLPLGSSLSAGLQGMVVDAAGVTYVTGTAGSSSNTDVLTAAIRPDGTILWSHAFNGTANWHDQARGIALAPGGVVYVTGNTPDAMSYANVLVLKYDAATGALLNTIQHSSGPGTSEHGGTIAVDAQGNVYVGGGTVGDGGDGLLLKFDAAGALVWSKTWDGPAWGPYSQDNVLQMLVAPTGEPVALVHGVMGSNQPDYVVMKLAPSDGSTVWQANWGVNGGDYAREMVMDAAGDVYVTGIGIDSIDKYSTIKLRGTDGQLLWQKYDAAGNDHGVAGIALDGQGGVYVTGAEDPDGDHSNFNDNFFTVKRDAATGAFVWMHRYGLNCIGCYDVPTDIAVDPSGNVFVAGATSSAPYSADVITFVLDAATGLEITRGVVLGAPPMTASAGILRFDAAWNLYDGGRVYNANTGAVEMSVFKYTSLDSSAGVPFCAGDGSAAACPCGNTSVAGSGNGCLSSLGVGARLEANGIASLSADSVVLNGTQMPNSSVLYFQGTTRQAGGMGTPFGDGLRCASGSVTRLAAKTNAAGASQYPDAGDPGVALKGGVGAPGIRTYQCWYRNAASFCTPSTYNLTNGLEITWSS